MNDTTSKIAALVATRHAQMSADERMQIACDMYDTARKMILSSLPATLSRSERRLAVARRMYRGELPEAALKAHANWQGDE